LISKLNGILDSVDQNSIVLDVNGVGYQVYVPSSALPKLPKLGQAVSMFTCQVVREDSNDLYGFLTKEERHLFSIILSVSGFGPKSAMNLISAFKIEQLVAAITRGNVELLSTVHGIGLKSAQKLVIELKEKVGKVFSVQKSDIVKGLPGEDPMVSDAISALITLGYTPHEARDAIMKVGVDFNKAKSVEDVIKQSLKSLS